MARGESKVHRRTCSQEPAAIGGETSIPSEQSSGQTTKMQENHQHLRRSWRTTRRQVGIALAILFLGWAGSTLAVTWSLTHRLAARQPEKPIDLRGITRRDFTLSTSDGETLGAWLFPGRPELPAFIVMHGNNGSRSRSRTIIELLARKGCTVLAVTLRAHGDSTGSINDIGWSARHDLVAAVDYLNAQFPGRPIAVCGRSMSSAAAIFAAKELGPRVAGYWLEQPYNSLETAAWRRLQQQLPPVCDAVAFAGMRMWCAALLPVSLGEIAPARCVCEIPEHCPIVILSGDADHNLPLADVEEVFDEVRDRAKLVVFKGAGHIAMPESDPALYEQELDAFLEAVVRSGRIGSQARDVKVSEGEQAQ
jgi:uncharacterized protein